MKYTMVVSFLIVGMFLSVKTGKLTITGALCGGLLGITIFLGAGFPGLVMLGTFFVLGSIATSWKLKYKVSVGLAEENKGRRTASQVIANGGVAGVLGMLSWLFPEKAAVFRLMLSAAFAAATADTLSSELGNVYGRRFYNIITFRTDNRGLNGVVSLEGTFMGLLGSGVIALIFGVGVGWNWQMGWIIIAGTVGNLADSVLGATLERKQFLHNDAVNFLNTLLGALSVLLMYCVISS